MKKSDLAEPVQQAAQVNSRQAMDLLAVIIEELTNALARGESVAVPGFGRFTVVEKPARTGRHPGTGEPIDIAAYRVPVFRPGKALKARVAGD